jgi:hypothetical protein
MAIDGDRRNTVVEVQHSQYLDSLFGQPGLVKASWRLRKRHFRLVLTEFNLIRKKDRDDIFVTIG